VVVDGCLEHNPLIRHPHIDLSSVLELEAFDVLAERVDGREVRRVAEELRQLGVGVDRCEHLGAAEGFKHDVAAGMADARMVKGDRLPINDSPAGVDGCREVARGRRGKRLLVIHACFSR
jgi:hypothetical protein